MNIVRSADGCVGGEEEKSQRESTLPFYRDARKLSEKLCQVRLHPHWHTSHFSWNVSEANNEKNVGSRL